MGEIERVYSSSNVKPWVVLAAILSLCVHGNSQTPPAGRQSSPPAPAPSGIRWNGLEISGSWRLRPEFWGWYNSDSANSSYTFLQSILRVNLGQKRKSWDWQIEIAQPTLLGTPDDAVAPAPQGQLGLGAAYFVSNGASRNGAFVFPSKAFVRLKSLGKDTNELTIGRFAFVDGTEVVPQDKTLAALKQMRIAHRLLGDFGFSVTGRSADGVKLSLNPGKTNLTFAAARATRGVFQVDGLGELDVAWEYGALIVPVGTGTSTGELRLFGLGYQDVRAVVKTDNRSLPLRSGADRFENINLGTFGLHYIHSLQTNRGTVDVLVWAAGQTGQWGIQDHSAGALAVELGWQPRSTRLKPWLRAGYFIGSGDGNPTDDAHNTFFQVLPTPRIYARFPFFNQMNNTDTFASLMLRPSKLTIRSDGHALWLTSRNDLWYQGGGAFQPRTFGYTSRPSTGARSLGYLWDISADYQATKHWTVGVYYAHVWGKGVQKNIYPTGQDANFGFIETTFRF